jgi:hypothetical protein
MVDPKPFVIVRDNFYPDPDAVRRLAQSMKYQERSDVTGFMTDEAYFPRGIRRRLERILGVKINRWDDDPGDSNGIFYGGFSSGKHKEIPSVHCDEPFDEITVLIYLTPGLPLEFGTSIWQHKRTGLIKAPTRADARRLGTTLTRLRGWLERDSTRRECWIEIDRVGYKYNRMVAYPNGLLHSASRHFGSDLAAGRLYQIFRVGISWSTLGVYA